MESFSVNMEYCAFPYAEDVTIAGGQERPPWCERLFKGVAFRGRAFLDALTEFPRQYIILKKAKQIPQVMVELWLHGLICSTT